MKNIKVSNILLHIFVIQSILLIIRANIICDYDPEIDLVRGVDDDPTNIYVYCPFHDPNYLGINSLIIMNRHGKALQCVNSSTIATQKGYEVDLTDEDYGFSFFTAKLYKDNILGVSMQTLKTKDHIYLNDFFWLFMDLNFNPIDGMVDLVIDLDSDAFEPGFNIAPHDMVLIDNDYAMIIINEYKVRDASIYFEKGYPAIQLYTSSLAILERKTSKLVATQSGFDFFMGVDDWVNWLSSRGRQDVAKGKDHFEFSHASSIMKVHGEHWDDSLNGVATFLISERHMNCIDLFTWDFKNGEKAQFIWRMPHSSSSYALEPWRARWEFINDPQNGPSHAHDVNTYNEPLKHIILNDNGDCSKYDLGNGLVCPISRAVEYKIELNANGDGYHRATLIWSHPPTEALPPALDGKVTASMPEGELSKDCMPVYHKYNYIYFGGSVRRLEPYSPLIGYSYYTLDNYDNCFPGVYSQYPYTTQYYRVVNQLNGQIYSAWNSTTAGYTSFRITSYIDEKALDVNDESPINKKYSNSNTIFK